VYDEYVRLYLSFFELFFPHPAMTSLAASYWLSLPDEPARLRTLHHYDVLPSQQEPVFDELVRLSAQVFSLPISLIALVDADEVTYKANLGLPGLQQQPRGEAICALVVCQRTPLVFTNLSRPRQLQRLTEMAAVAAQAKSILFYAGAPLHMPTQYPIGSLCVIGYAPRNFSAEEQQLLKQLADIVSELITVRHICLTHEKATQRGRWQWLQTLHSDTRSPRGAEARDPPPRRPAPAAARAPPRPYLVYACRGSSLGLHYLGRTRMGMVESAGLLSLIIF
jgi:hypothetical protein